MLWIKNGTAVAYAQLQEQLRNEQIIANQAIEKLKYEQSVANQASDGCATLLATEQSKWQHQ
eukprot:6728573-Karenia_brevis.AAC.1